MRSYIKRIQRRPAPPVLTAVQREELEWLLVVIPDGAGESHRAFVSLLEHWFGIPSEFRPVVVPAYRTFNGMWLTAGVPQVTDAIRRALEVY
jgi:hypothetical protein